MANRVLRDWSCGSYKEDGRPVSSLENKEAPRQMPRASTGVSGDDKKGGSADPGRRNK